MAKNYLDGSLHSARVIFGAHVGHSVTGFNRCVGRALSGQRGGGAEQAQYRFSGAAQSCSGGASYARRGE